MIIKLSPYIFNLLSKFDLLRKENTITPPLTTTTTQSNIKLPLRGRTSWNVLSDLHHLHSDSESSSHIQDSIKVSYQDEKTKTFLKTQIFEFNGDNTTSSTSTSTINSLNQSSNENQNHQIIDLHDVWISGIKLAINLTSTNSLIMIQNKRLLETIFESFIKLFSWRTSHHQSLSIDLPFNVSIILLFTTIFFYFFI